MKFLPYLVIGGLIIAALFSTLGSNNNANNLTTNTMQDMPTPTPETFTVQGEIQEIPEASTATILTNKGEIVIELFPEAAPNTVNNFAEKSDSGFYNNLTFHRVEDWVVQGGDPLGNGQGGEQMRTELNNNPFIRGSVGVARAGNIEISNDAQFFITKTDAPHLDSQYTNFGQVSSGLEVVDSLEIGDRIISITIN